MLVVVLLPPVIQPHLVILSESPYYSAFAFSTEERRMVWA